MGPESARSLVLLQTCSSPLETNLIRSLLEAHGVTCFVHGEHHSAIVGPLGYVAVRLMVPADQHELAERLLRDILAQQEPAPAPPAPPHLGGYRDAYLPQRPPQRALVWRPLHTRLALGSIALVLLLALAVVFG